jgi:type I restriction enzyme S subunit
MNRAAYTTRAVDFGALRALNFSPEAERLRSRRAPMLGEFLSLTGRNYGKIFVRVDCDEAVGEGLITQSDMFAAEPVARFIRGDAIQGLEDHRIHRGQILIAGAGQMGETDLFGRSILVDKRLDGLIIGPHALRLSAMPGQEARYLYAYAMLLSPLGLRLVRSCAYGTSVPSIRADLLFRLPIPTADDETTDRVINLISLATECRERFSVELRAARRVVEGLPEMRAVAEMCRLRVRRCVSWGGPLPTMTAWTFASAGEALDVLRSRWKTKIADIVEPDGVFRGGRYTRVKCQAPYGVEFLAQRDIFTTRQVPQRILRPPVSDRLLYAPPHAIAAGGKGTLGEGEIFGRCVMVGSDLAEYALTEDILRIVPLEEVAPLAYAYLSTQVGFRLLRSTASGTKLLTCREDLVTQLPFPEPGSKDTALIRRHVEAGVAARSSAIMAEQEAIRIIEEEVLPRWLT